MVEYSGFKSGQSSQGKELASVASGAISEQQHKSGPKGKGAIGRFRREYIAHIQECKAKGVEKLAKEDFVKGLAAEFDNLFDEADAKRSQITSLHPNAEELGLEVIRLSNRAIDRFILYEAGEKEVARTNNRLDRKAQSGEGNKMESDRQRISYGGGVVYQSGSGDKNPSAGWWDRKI